MGTDLRWTKLGVALVLSCGLLCMGTATTASAEQQRAQKKSKKQQPQLPPLPSGPTGPVQQIPLDSIAAVPPQVTFQDNQLTIVAPNSTLGDILRAVHKQTGAEIEVPSAPERVVTRLGPGPARDVMAELLNGSRFNYVLLGSEGNDAALTRVVLVAKSGAVVSGPAESSMGQSDARFKGGQQPAIEQANDAQPQEDMQETEAADDNGNADDNADQNPNEAEGQQAPPQDQPGVKTPQQMLQEMQQRQLQLQQQQPPGQPPVPGSGMPPHPPQEN